MQPHLNGKSPEFATRPSLLRSPRVWLGVPISLLFLVLAFRGQHPDEIRDALSRVDWRLLPVALVLLYTGIAIRAYRWHILLRPVHDIPTREVFPVMIVGYAANNVLPLRMGELVRAWVLEQRYGVRKSAALATIAVERLCDGVTMLLFVAGAATAIGLNA
ncbi:MAG: lysylphosphatidylglycerol synthase transmembrane domain-containing protein, partial [Thermomicrobiales bacterium]